MSVYRRSYKNKDGTKVDKWIVDVDFEHEFAELTFYSCCSRQQVNCWEHFYRITDLQNEILEDVLCIRC